MDSLEEDFNWWGDGEQPAPKAKKSSPLDTVLPFDRPASASPDDRIVGKDEFGQRIYETSTGYQYTIRPASPEESKTDRAKVEEWIDKGAPLPGWDQITETMKGMPSAVVGGMEDLLAGRGTVGDVMSAAAPMAASGVRKVQRQAARIEGAVSPQQVKVREDDVFRGNGPVTTSLDKATKPFAVRLTGESQIEDMIKSGLVRPKEGGYGQDKKAILYFGEMDEPVPTSVFTKPKDDPNKNYTIVMDSTKAAGREGPIRLDELQHVWTTRDGELVDVLPELLVKNRNYKPKFAEGGMVENIDPVSKNPVPPGASPKEVRDDIDIKVSEGEYVIPANVVRYLGLERIEKLVSGAKQKLEELDVNGRIGGKQEGEDDLPFSPEELMAIDEPAPQADIPKMAVGGLVTPPNPNDQLPYWMRRNTVQTPTITPEEPLNALELQRGDRRDTEETGPTGLAGSVHKWTPNDFEKYGTARNSVEQKAGQYLTSMVPFGGMLGKMRERYLERTVPTELKGMLESKKDLQGNELTKDQLDNLQGVYDKITTTPLDGYGRAGLIRQIGEETGLVKPRSPEKVEKRQEKIREDSLINRLLDSVTKDPNKRKEEDKDNTANSGKSSDTSRPPSPGNSSSKSKDKKK